MCKMKQMYQEPKLRFGIGHSTLTLNPHDEGQTIPIIRLLNSNLQNVPRLPETSDVTAD